jgi:5-oxoprolinase (ATP-hydrolysing) subunit A
MKPILNCDLGEVESVKDLEFDLSLLPFLGMANIACGEHAGSVEVIDALVAACVERSVLVGAHPSFPDREGMGRRSMAASPDLVKRWTLEQVGRVAVVARRHRSSVFHVKPHGALYHSLMKDTALATAFVDAIEEVIGPQAVVVGLADGALEKAAAERGMRCLGEAFADRRYLPDGTLQPRGLPGSVLAATEAIEQGYRMIRTGTVMSAGGPVSVRFDTICVHSDSPDARGVLQALHGMIQSMPEAHP